MKSLVKVFVRNLRMLAARCTSMIQPPVIVHSFSTIEQCVDMFFC